MAGLCLDCINKYEIDSDDKLTLKDVKIEYDLCEYCGKYNKPCVVKIKKKALHKLTGEKPISLFKYFIIKTRGY